MRTISILSIAFVLALFVSACAGSSEPAPAPPPPTVRQSPPPAPPPEPEPAPPPAYEARELPKTASSRPALALGGLAALAGAGALHWLRRRL